MLQDLAGARDHARLVQHAVEEGVAALRPLGTERPLVPPEKAQPCGGEAAGLVEQGIVSTVSSAKKSRDDGGATGETSAKGKCDSSKTT